MIALVWAANILGWPILHLTVAFITIRLPSRLFAHDTWLTAPQRWERGGRVYQQWFAIRRWKASLPDGAPWMGGFSKKRLRCRRPDYLSQFLIETRRSEIAHWCMLACLPIFFLWNPPWACAVMTLYAALANLPCILVQRYNRIALSRRAHLRDCAPASQ